MWAGRAGRPFVVSSRKAWHALHQVRRDALWTIGVGVAAIAYVAYGLVNGF